LKALLLDQPGAITSLRAGEISVPEPGSGEIRVKVEALGLNPVDYKQAGRGNDAWSYPHLLGLDVAGTVDAVGQGADEWSVGESVFYHGDLKRPGGFAEYAITTAHTTARIPDSVSYVDAAAIPCAGLTAYQGIVRKLKVQAGQTVWVQGGAGGVGGYGVQLCANIGATVITTASPGSFDHVKGLGAAHVIDYNSEDVVARIMDITDSRGLDAVQAAVDAESANQGIAALAFSGAISLIAGLPDMGEEIFDKSISLHKISLGAAHHSNNRDAQVDLARMADEMIAMIADGTVDAMVERVVGFDEIPGSLAEIEQRHVRGKIVATLE
jgi:NADPH:quinone reductase-like Zn-dependent oxidoreductase